MARLVITHSTYIDGLVSWLKSLSKIKGIKTITPGVIKKTKGKSEQLKINVSTKIKGGFKLIARKGRLVQEVFLITEKNEEELRESIYISKPQKKISKSR